MTERRAPMFTISPAQFDEARYHERTQRNQHWVGGKENQEKLRHMRVAIGGAGCFGSGVALLLVRAGVGYIRIADPDRIEESNINRQVMAAQKTVGMYKVDALREMLRGIANDFELATAAEAVTTENADEFVDSCDVVVDEIDVFEPAARIALHKAARSRGIPIYAGCAVGYGCRTYKFVGEEYTIEKFLGKSAESESFKELLDRVGPPFPSYLDKEGRAAYERQFAQDKAAALCGSTAAMGVAFISARITGDYLSIPAGRPTPVMPEYVAMDAADMTMTVARVE